MDRQKTKSTASPFRSGRYAEQDITNERYYHGVDIIALLFYLLKRLVWIVIAAVIGAVVGRYQYTKTYIPIYQATSKIYIAGSDTTISIADLQLGSTLAKDYQEAFKIWQVHEAVAERLGLNYSPAALSDMVSVKVPTASHILYITTQSTDPEEARLLADTYAEVVQEFIAEKMELRRPQILEKAQKPKSPVASNRRQAIKDGAVMGGMAVALAFAVIFLVDDRVRSAGDVANAVALPVLGALPTQRFDGKKSAAASPVSYPRGVRTAVIRAIPTVDYSFSEALNAICTAISFSGNGLRKIVVSSSGADEGKTFVTLQLSLSMAKRGKRILLMDCDLRKSVMQSRYGIQLSGTGAGLAHLLSGQCSLSEAVYATNVSNLFLMPAGELVTTPLALVSSAEFDHILKRLQNSFDMILLDTPPIGAIIDAAEIARCCDGSILIVASNQTHARALKEAAERLRQTGIPILGCIINRKAVKKRKFSSYSGYSDSGARKTFFHRLFNK